MTVFGTNFNDTLVGLSGSDTIFAYDGDDFVYLSDIQAQNGSDVVYLGSGDDVVYVTGNGELLYGEGGNDTLDFSMQSNSVVIDLVPIAYSAGHAYSENGITAFGFEDVVGSINADRIYGDSYDNRFDGSFGSDVIHGRSGNDVLIGGGGDDVVVGGSGLDVIFGGAGVDWFEFFGANSGYYQASERDYIVDFEIGLDKIAIDIDLADSFGELLQNASIYQDETSTVIEFNNGSELLILNFFDVSNVNQDMFLFYQI
jgi:Ca2+-binding RTX toxin-like protein